MCLIMEIILVRHAKTEEKREDLDDIRRYLTEKGKREFQKRMPELREKLEPIEGRQIMIWSSPAMRAFETAHIVAGGLQLTIDAIQHFIYAGDFEKMSQEVQVIDDETTLFIVGHEPSLSKWTKKMTGEELKIKKGDILSFKVTNRIPLEAELQWVISS